MNLEQKTIKPIFENEHFIIIDKPVPMSFEGHDGVLAKLREVYQDVYGVHRLDRATSGLMIFAKNKDTQRELSEMFAERIIHKTYIAISTQRPLKKMGTIKGDLIKGRGGNYLLKRTVEKPSVTNFKSFYDSSSDLRLFILKPLTGQTHQLRVHLKSIGSPILGDERYGGDKSDRMYLASVKLDFTFRDEEFSFSHYPVFGEYFLEESVKSVFENLDI